MIPLTPSSSILTQVLVEIPVGERKILLIVIAILSIVAGIVRDWAKLTPAKRSDAPRVSPNPRAEREELKNDLKVFMCGI